MGTVPVSKHSGIRGATLQKYILGIDLLPGHWLKLLGWQGWQMSFVWDSKSLSKPPVTDIWCFELSGKLVLSLSKG